MYKDNKYVLDYITREADKGSILGGIFDLTNDKGGVSTLVLYKEDDKLLITMSKSVDKLTEKYKVLSLSSDTDLDIIVASAQIKSGKIVISKFKDIDEFLDDKFGGYSIIEAIKNLDRDDINILNYKIIEYLSDL
jgi:hypothetical protein